MKENEKKMELLGNAPVPRALLALGLPTMVGMMINALYNLVDAYFVGGLGTSQMGAITVAFPLGQVVVGLGLLFGNGAASCLSRLLGQGDRENANRVASTALYSSIFVGALVIFCCVIWLEPILGRLGASDSVMPYALSYTGIYIVCSIFNVFNVTMNNIVSSEGAAKTTMCVLLAGAVLNLVLDPIFIYGLDLGVAGAAIATGISQCFSALVYLAYILGKRSVFHFSIRDFRLSGNIMSEILKIGIPTMAFQLLTSLSMSMINDRAREYGDYALAAMGAVTKIMSVGSLMVFGFLKGLQPIAGYSYGSKKYDRLGEAVKISIIWSTVFCAVFGLAAAPNDLEVHQGGPGYDPGGPGRAADQRFVLCTLWVLYGLLIPVSGNGESERGLFFGRLPAGNLLRAGDPYSAGNLGIKRNPLRPAGGGRGRGIACSGNGGVFAVEIG